ncbi:MAG: rane protein implicated in regulation of rane protease [Verrucomicrobiales bacterium]|nr:rane protein implicated in regulation of rane protease [Verrucomicrobiales bacterium]
MQSWHLWTIAGLLMIILEMLTPAFFFASFGLAALITATLAAQGFNTTSQLGFFAGISVLCMAAVRPLFVRFIYNPRPIQVNAHALVGQSASVVDAIGAGDDPGRVKVGGEEWRAISASGNPLPPGLRVEIIAVDSATLTVRPRV